MAAAGNPLAAPRARPPISPASGQVAELNRPPLFTGRVSSYTLRGTHDSLVRQNARSEEENLERIEDDADLQDRIARGPLVRVPESAALAVNPALPDDRRYCRPWTADFLDRSRTCPPDPVPHAARSQLCGAHRRVPEAPDADQSATPPTPKATSSARISPAPPSTSPSPALTPRNPLDAQPAARPIRTPA